MQRDTPWSPVYPPTSTRIPAAGASASALNLRTRRAFTAILDPTLIAITYCGVCTALTCSQQDGAVWRRCHYTRRKVLLPSIDVWYLLFQLLTA